MKTLDRTMMATLYLVTGLYFYNLTLTVIDTSGYVLETLSDVLFLIFALTAPFYFFLRWFMNKGFSRYQRFILSLLPLVLYLIWTIAITVLLG
jgi:hypothetical protein